MSDQSHAERREQKRTCWKRHLDRWRTSGLTQIEYCRRHQLKAHQFTYWKKRLAPADDGITFVPVDIRSRGRQLAAAASSSLRLIVDGDLQIEVTADFDPQLLRRLIASLRSRS